MIATDWDKFNRVIGGGDGVIYAIDAIGNLHWYKDTHRDGTPATAAGAPSFDAPNEGATIGIGWNMFTTVFSGGNGVLYGIDGDGNLRWYKDTHRDGTLMDSHVPNHAATIGIRWGSFTQVFSGGNGVLYAIDRDGNLHWYKDTHRDGTPATAASATLLRRAEQRRPDRQRLGKVHHGVLDRRRGHLRAGCSRRPVVVSGPGPGRDDPVG